MHTRFFGASSRCGLCSRATANPLLCVGNQKFTKTGHRIGALPMMLRCNKCHLYQKTEEELGKMKECPYDPGGYFIVKGVEKAFLMQEQLSKNRIIIEGGKFGVQATCASHTHTSKAKTTLVFGKDNGLYLKHNSLTDLMPIFIVMRAMGVQSDQELVQMVGTEPSFSLYLYPCIHACQKNNVYTQNDALEFFGSKMKPRQSLSGKEMATKKVCWTQNHAHERTWCTTPPGCKTQYCTCHVVRAHDGIDRKMLRRKSTG